MAGTKPERKPGRPNGDLAWTPSSGADAQKATYAVGLQLPPCFFGIKLPFSGLTASCELSRMEKFAGGTGAEIVNDRSAVTRRNGTFQVFRAMPEILTVPGFA